MIIVKDLTKKYQVRGQEITVGRNLSFSIEKGCIFGLLGPNGAGKTTRSE